MCTGGGEASRQVTQAKLSEVIVNHICCGRAIFTNRFSLIDERRSSEPSASLCMSEHKYWSYLGSAQGGIAAAQLLEDYTG